MSIFTKLLSKSLPDKHRFVPHAPSFGWYVLHLLTSLLLLRSMQSLVGLSNFGQCCRQGGCDTRGGWSSIQARSLTGMAQPYSGCRYLSCNWPTGNLRPYVVRVYVQPATGQQKSETLSEMCTAASMVWFCLVVVEFSLASSLSHGLNHFC